MQQQTGLRERKKQQTARALWTAAIKLFTEHGYDSVSIAQIAAAADVSKMTVFNYFPTKEDLVLGPLEQHTDDPARVVRDRPDGVSVLSALRRHVLTCIAERDPVIGMSDNPQVLAVYRLVLGTPALHRRAARSAHESEGSLAGELARDLPEMVARIAAAQITGVLGALRHRNLQRLIAGDSPDTVEPDAVADAHLGFDILQHGLAPHLPATT